MKILYFIFLLMMIVSTGCQQMSHVKYPMDWPQKKSSTSQCPDISGIYYDRVGETYSDTDRSEQDIYRDPFSYHSPVVKAKLCKPYVDQDYESSDSMDPVCSLGFMLGLLECSYFMPKCPERKIKISQTNNLNILRISSLDNENILNFEHHRYRCEDGSIIVGEQGEVDEFNYERSEIFPADNGSLILMKYSRGVVGTLYPAPLIGPATSMKLYRWDRVDSGANPYEDDPWCQQ